MDKIKTMSEEESNAYTLNPMKFTPMKLKSIGLVYGDMCKEIINQLLQNPAKAIPIVFQRLEQRHNMYIENRELFVLNWKERAEKNYYKSLDHKSIMFK